MLGFTYTKPNKPIMTPSRIMIYQTHASQPNIHCTLGGFDKSSESACRWGPAKTTLRSDKPVSSDGLRSRVSLIILVVPSIKLKTKKISRRQPWYATATPAHEQRSTVPRWHVKMATAKQKCGKERDIHCRTFYLFTQWKYFNQKSWYSIWIIIIIIILIVQTSIIWWLLIGIKWQ